MAGNACCLLGNQVLLGEPCSLHFLAANGGLELILQALLTHHSDTHNCLGLPDSRHLWLLFPFLIKSLYWTRIRACSKLAEYARQQQFQLFPLLLALPL